MIVEDRFGDWTVIRQHFTTLQCLHCSQWISPWHQMTYRVCSGRALGAIQDRDIGLISQGSGEYYIGYDAGFGVNI